MTDHHAALVLNDADTLQIERYPIEQRAALIAFASAFPEGNDLIYTNPPLAVALVNARAWDTFGLTTVDHRFISTLLRQRRRKICAAFGFPSCERVVRILSKVQPQACYVDLLARVRGALRNLSLLSILSHLTIIGAVELTVAADLVDCPNVSFTLYADLVMHFTRESNEEWRSILRQTSNLLQPRRDENRLFEWAGPSRDEMLARIAHGDGRKLRSVMHVRRSYYRFWNRLVDLTTFDPSNDYTDLADIQFPAAPLPGIDIIQPIHSGAVLVDEARAMGHCVLDYAEHIAVGCGYLYRVLNPERATLWIARRNSVWGIEQLAGVRNQAVSLATKYTVESWLRQTQSLIHNV